MLISEAARFAGTLSELGVIKVENRLDALRDPSNRREELALEEKVKNEIAAKRDRRENTVRMRWAGE